MCNTKSKMNNNLYIKLSKNEYVKNNIDNYLNDEKKWKESCELLFKYCNENKCVPYQKTKYENQNIGMWLGTQKRKINDVNNELYKKMSINEYVKNNLDQYLENVNENKDKIKLKWEEIKELLFRYCNENKCVPQQKIKYENQNIGEWLQDQKRKINNVDDELYIKLISNEYIKYNLNDYLKNKESKRDTEKLEWDESCNLLFKFCNENQCVPQQKTKYENHNIGKWFHHQKEKICNINNVIYIKLSKNIYIKNNLDEYIKKNSIKNNQTNIKADENDLIALDSIGLSRAKNVIVNVGVIQMEEIPNKVIKIVKKKNIEVA